MLYGDQAKRWTTEESVFDSLQDEDFYFSPDSGHALGPTPVPCTMDAERTISGGKEVGS
jgi:hypothetical protein